MQQILFTINIRVESNYVNNTYAQVIEDKLYDIPGVELVSREWFTYDINIKRPTEQSGKSISDEIKTFILGIDHVVRATEVDWSRY